MARMAFRWRADIDTFLHACLEFFREGSIHALMSEGMYGKHWSFLALSL